MKKLNISDDNTYLVDAADFNKIRYAICELLDANKSEKILMLNLKPLFTYDLWFIIVTALSVSHLKKLCQEIIFSLRKRGIYSANVPNDVDYESGWVALDYGELIIHVFMKDKRDFYNLEELWQKAIFEEYP